MVPREELIQSAVTFLQDPSVATSGLDKRRAFLESKNLTAEEIELAFARAGSGPGPVQNASAPTNYYPPPQQGSPYPYNHSPYAGQWPQQPPPRRDWRDWFIMATVTTGVSYTLYSLAKRYVVPMIAPPTPPQIEQDKAAIDAEFTKAFALIDQLASDTAELKSAEAERKEKLDSALEEVETVIAELKMANKRREDDALRIQDEVRSLREMIPKSLEGWKSDGDNRLRELGNELKSLKMLIGNRVGGNVPTPRPGPTGSTGSAGSTTSSTPAAAPASVPSGPAQEATSVPAPTTGSSSAPGVTAPRKDTSSPFSFEGKSGRAIPAWQKAAAEKSAPSPTVTNVDETIGA